jgi:hypothetical protein
MAPGALPDLLGDLKWESLGLAVQVDGDRSAMLASPHEHLGVRGGPEQRSDLRPAATLYG